MTNEQLNNAINNLPENSNNISNALSRIKGLRDILITHGKELTLALSVNSKLEEVVRQYNKIVKQDTPIITSGTIVGDIVVDRTKYIEISPGYYPKGFTVTGTTSNADQETAVQEALESLKKDLQSQLPSIDNVLYGTDTIVITDSGDNSIIESKKGVAGDSNHRLTAGDYNEENDKSKTLKLVANNTISLYSDIPYYDARTREVQITIRNDDKEEITYVEADKLPEGYYKDGVQIIPVLNKGENNNKVINVQTEKLANISSSEGISITPDRGFDYLKNVKVSVSPGTSTVDVATSGNVITITPSVTEGWISGTTVTGADPINSSNSYKVTIPINTASDGNAIVGEQDLNKDNINESVVTIPQGYYDGKTAIPLAFRNSNSETPVRIINTIPNVTFDDDIPKITIDPGLVTRSLKTSFDKSTVSVSSDTVVQNEVTKAATKVIAVTSNEGYTKGETTIITVRDSSTPELTYEHSNETNTDKVIINIEEGGWAEGTVDVSQNFITLADAYTSNLTEGTVSFDYNDLKTVDGGTITKNPSSPKRYFSSATVDLSALIAEINEI